MSMTPNIKAVEERTPACDYEEKIYGEVLAEARVSRSEEAYANKYPGHAKIANFQLFELAASLQKNGKDTPVKIVTGSLPDHVFKPSSDGPVDAFLKAGGRIQVLIWCSPIENCGTCLREKATEFKSQITFRAVEDSGEANEIPHFLLVGEEAYRIERPHSPFKGPITDTTPEVAARICFNDPVFGKNLSGFFNAIWDMATPVAG